MSKSTSRKASLPTLPESVHALAETDSFSGSDSLAHAARIAMAKHVVKLYDHLPGVQTGDDPHDVHQMRVATRRLRASLEATAPVYQEAYVGKLRKRLRVLARILGEVRDRDVLLMRLRNDAAQQANDEPIYALIEKPQSGNGQDGLAVVIEQLQAERDKVHADLLRELGRKRTARLLHDLNDFLTMPLTDVQSPDDGLPLLVHHHAGSAIWHEYESIRRFETAMPNAPSERLHELRIACKHLRYTLELFEPALGENARDLIKQVTAMQEHLGDLHDADVALLYLDKNNQEQHQRSGAADDGTDDGTDVESQSTDLAAYVESRKTQRQELLNSVGPLWNELSGETSRRQLAKLIGRL